MVADQPQAMDTVAVRAAQLPTSVSDAAFSIIQIDPNPGFATTCFPSANLGGSRPVTDDFQ